MRPVIVISMERLEGGYATYKVDADTSVDAGEMIGAMASFVRFVADDETMQTMYAYAQQEVLRESIREVGHEVS